MDDRVASSTLYEPSWLGLMIRRGSSRPCVVSTIILFGDFQISFL
jgi:hypothetical protein